MAKQLYPECTDVKIVTIQISQKEDESGIVTYCVIIGESLDSDGNNLIGQDVHGKILLDSDSWDYSNIDKTIKDVAGLVKDELKNIIKEKTDIDV